MSGVPAARVAFYFRLHEVRLGVGDADMAELTRRFPTVEFRPVDDDAALPAAVADAEVFAGFIFPADLFSAARRLRWVHSASAGIEANLFPALVDSDVVLTNAAGLHSVNIPEHCLALMLSLARNFHVAYRLKARREWNRFEVIAGGGGMRELAGANVAILGAGAIGAALARLTHALGMRVRVLRRRAGLPVEGAEDVVGPEALLSLLSWADFVVLAAPLTEDTRGLIDARALAAMKSSAHLVNVGRGELVDDAALVEALRRGAIAGAGLDVFADEPLPASSPYWTLDNVIITPHVSGYMPDFLGRQLRRFADNLERFLAGRPLEHIVDKRLGYSVPPA